VTDVCRPPRRAGRTRRSKSSHGTSAGSSRSSGRQAQAVPVHRRRLPGRLRAQGAPLSSSLLLPLDLLASSAADSSLPAGRTQPAHARALRRAPARVRDVRKAVQAPGALALLPLDLLASSAADSSPPAAQPHEAHARALGRAPVGVQDVRVQVQDPGALPLSASFSSSTFLPAGG